MFFLPFTYGNYISPMFLTCSFDKIITASFYYRLCHLLPNLHIFISNLIFQLKSSKMVEIAS